VESTYLISVYKFESYPLVQDDLQRSVLLRGAYGISPRSITGRHLLQLIPSPRTTEASARWQFGALTNKKATSSNTAISTSSLYLRAL